MLLPSLRWAVGSFFPKISMQQLIYEEGAISFTCIIDFNYIKLKRLTVSLTYVKHTARITCCRDKPRCKDRHIYLMSMNQILPAIILLIALSMLSAYLMEAATTRPPTDCTHTSCINQETAHRLYTNQLHQSRKYELTFNSLKKQKIVDQLSMKMYRPSYKSFLHLYV